MNSDLRRSSRYDDFFPISISVEGENRESEIDGALSGRIVNISNHGACLLLTRVMLDTFHIFHSTREDDRCSLKLHIKLSGDKKTLVIRTQPVWLDMTHIDDLKVFKMGVDFLQPIDHYQIKEISNMLKRS